MNGELEQQVNVIEQITTDNLRQMKDQEALSSRAAAATFRSG